MLTTGHVSLKDTKDQHIKINKLGPIIFSLLDQNFTSGSGNKKHWCNSFIKSLYMVSFENLQLSR